MRSISSACCAWLRFSQCGRMRSVSVMLGALVLQERLDKNPPWHAVMAIAALCLALIGAVVISSAREKERELGERALEPDAARVQPATG